jgi:DNA-binding LacI/PurR family transcriptional regulator
MGIAHQMGRRVPQDLAIVGFDNTPEAAFFWPPLTTIYQQLVDVGRIAVKNLHEMILSRQSQAEPRPPSFSMLKPELIIRASSSIQNSGNTLHGNIRL